MVPALVKALKCGCAEQYLKHRAPARKAEAPHCSGRCGRVVRDLAPEIFQLVPYLDARAVVVASTRLKKTA